MWCNNMSSCMNYMYYWWYIGEYAITSMFVGYEYDLMYWVWMLYCCVYETIVQLIRVI